MREAEDDEDFGIAYPLAGFAVGGRHEDGLILIGLETGAGRSAISMTPSQAGQLVASLLEWSAQSPMNLQGRSTTPGEMRVQAVEAKEVGISDGGDKTVVLAFPVGLLTLAVRIGWNKLARVLNAYSEGQRQSPGQGAKN